MVYKTTTNAGTIITDIFRQIHFRNKSGMSFPEHFTFHKAVQERIWHNSGQLSSKAYRREEKRKKGHKPSITKDMNKTTL